MAKLEKLYKRCAENFAAKEFYEAHQIAKTIFHRELESKNHEKLSKFLYAKALDFINVNERTSALDLADLYVQTLSTGALPLNDERLSEIQTLFQSLPATLPTLTESKERDCRTAFTNKVLRWSADVAPEKHPENPGDTRVMQIVAPMLAAYRRQQDDEEMTDDEEEQKPELKNRDLIHEDLD
ncbi:hypothetical protein M3Y95_00861400 [Aphelenchoides besseyi]|nr:hypothetical protein M3Y95_00861400 [Aphelenchoides besseyi]